MNKLILGFILAGLACIGAGVVIGASIYDKKRYREFDLEPDDADEEPKDEIKIDVDAMDISDSAAVQNTTVDDDVELKEEKK